MVVRLASARYAWPTVAVAVLVGMIAVASIVLAVRLVRLEPGMLRYRVILGLRGLTDMLGILHQVQRLALRASSVVVHSRS